MKKTKLTRSLLAACSIVALSAVMYGCTHGGDDPVAKPPPMDMDGDGVADADDAFPNDPTETADADGDGVGDNADLDDDNDGVADVHDGLPLNPMETKDTDGDGVGDNADLDDDGDGVADADDAFPNDATETADADGDGVGDNADAFPMNAMETADADGDGVGDNADAFPMDAMETADADGDGVGDNADAFPMDATETADADMDGTGDNADAFPMDATETADADMDGTGDNADAFPMDATETADADMDGTGDNADAFPMDATETADADMDGTGDNADAFPMDATETADADMDGTGNNADVFPFNKDETADSDMDGTGDNADAFDDDPTETVDSDGDGRGDNADAFPMDATETADSDMDGVGDNADAFPNDVISLLEHANARDLDLGDPADVDLAAALARAKDARLMAVSDVIHSAAGDHTDTDDGDRDQDSSTTAGTGSTSTVTASWFGRDLDDPDTAETDESTMPTLSITVTTTSGSDLTFRTEAAEDDSDTTDIDESMTMPKTATMLDRGLGDFGHGYQIEEGGSHAIVFTNKMQGADEVAAVTAVTFRYVEDQEVDATTGYSLGTDKTGPTFTGVTWTPSGEEPLTGTLSCVEAGCDIELNADGTIAEIEGYEFTGSRDAVAAVTAADAMEDTDYLAFGVWLQEDTNGDTAGSPKSFAAFANGGEPIDSFADYETLTGTANYSGDAAGVYTQGDSVDWFDASASLTANFGAPGTDEDPEADDDEIGTVSGTISNIMVGGVDTGDEISLRSADIENMNTAFSGNARMGTGVIQDDDSVEYPYNGTWSGNFFGAVAAVPDDTDTADVDESMPIMAPEAVAGTFGVSGTMGEGDDAVTSTYVGAFGARR